MNNFGMSSPGITWLWDVAACVGSQRRCFSTPGPAPHPGQASWGTGARAVGSAFAAVVSVAVCQQLQEDRAGGQLRGLHGAELQVSRGLLGPKGPWWTPRGWEVPASGARPPQASPLSAGTGTPVSLCVSGCTSCCWPCARWTWAWSRSCCSGDSGRGCRATASPWLPTAPLCLPSSQASRRWRPKTLRGCGGEH